LDTLGVVIKDGAVPAAEHSLDERRSWLDSLLNEKFSPRGVAASFESRVRAKVALCREQVDAAEDLVRRRYAWRGYSLGCESRSSTAPLVTLLAQSGEHLLGTLTVRPGGSLGLFAEHSYRAEIDALRQAGRRVGELIRLAMEEGADWKPALEALVRSAYVVTRFMHALTDVVIEVNPRHARFYERIFGFIVAAPERFCSRVGAPSVLMRLDLEQFGLRLQSLKI